MAKKLQPSKSKRETWQPLQRAVRLPNKYDGILRPNEDKEVWKNNLYTVIVNRDLESAKLKYTWLSIRRNDRSACKDWRHFQFIKNQLVGEECEGIEIYPAESRLVDNANQYHLWVTQDPTIKVPFGFGERAVTEKQIIEGSVQRRFPDNMIPEDLREQEERMENAVNNSGLFPMEPTDESDLEHKSEL